MKTTPTDIDREAGSLFAARPAMRVMWTSRATRWERVADGTTHTGRPFAIDADDPATVGVMLAQVTFAIGEVVAVWEFHDGFRVVAPPDEPGAWCRFVGEAPCKYSGAALVAAMKAVSK